MRTAGASRPAGRSGHHAPAWETWAALGLLYVVWGSTYLAIKVAIDTLPPFLMAATRFLLAGTALYVWSIRRGDRHGDRPGRTQWLAAAVIGGTLLTVGNGGVTWAEQRGVPTGVVALVIATIPLWMALIDRIANGVRIPPLVGVGLVVGFSGLALLLLQGVTGEIDGAGVAVSVIASLSWAGGSVYARSAALPSRPLVGASMEMLCGAAFLALLGTVTGEWGRAHLDEVSIASLLALGYLVVFGSLGAYSAYVWLRGTARLSLVSTYAYVNPVVAVLLGWVFLSEPLTSRTVLASAIILVSVALIVTARARETAAPPTDAVPAPALRRGRIRSREQA